MSVRNFYIDARIDGRESHIKGGPARKDGGLSIILTQRDKGSIIEAFRIESIADGDTLRTIIWSNGEFVAEFKTER